MQLELTERLPDWSQRLNAYIRDIQNKDMQFEYGKLDCCLFAAGAVEAVCGIDPMEEFRGTYDDRPSSLATRLEQTGTTSLYRILRRKFGPPAHGAQGQYGDIVFFQGNCGVSLGKFALFLGENGWSLIRISFLERAFKIGHK